MGEFTWTDQEGDAVDAVLGAHQWQVEDDDGFPVEGFLTGRSQSFAKGRVLDALGPHVGKRVAEVLDFHRCDEQAERAYHRARNAEARVAVLLAALNVALNSDDQDALAGARFALEEVRDEDLTLLHEIEQLRGAVARAEVLADKWRNEEMPDPATADEDLRAALAIEGAS